MAKLLLLTKIMLIPKGLTHNLSPYMSAKEMQCQCKRKACHYTLVSGKLVTAFHTVRDIIGEPLHINSGYRCQAHNHEVGGVDHSSHTTGHAIDISLIGHDEDRLEEVLKEYFDVVLRYNTFFHCQING